MKKNFLRKLIITGMVLVATTTTIACRVNDKETIISTNVSQEVKAKENEIEKTIELGNEFLQQGKYEDARKTYEKAISMDCGNKFTYLSIKDRYIEKGRVDDAYYVIRLALDNKVDYTNMQNISEEIKKKFVVTNSEETIMRNGSYKFPEKVFMKINDKDIFVKVKWNNAAIDTSKPGTYTFYGEAEEYNRPIILTLNVEDAKIGYIKEVYENDGKRYLKFDEVEFFIGEKGVEERRKDRQKRGIPYTEESLRWDDGWFIKDDDDVIKNYEISNSAPLSVSAYLMEEGAGSTLKAVLYEKFKDIVSEVNSKHPGVKSRNILCWITLENNVIIKVRSQYTP